MGRVLRALLGRLLLLLALVVLAAVALTAGLLVLGSGQQVARDLAKLRPPADTAPASADTKPVVTATAPTAVLLRGYGAQPAWLPNGDSFICQRNVAGVMELFIDRGDGGDSRCLTLGGAVPAELRGKHKGNAVVHPSGKYVLFTAENRQGDHGQGTLPESGYDHDLWAMSIDGGKYWRLAETPERQAVAGLVLSRDGRRLLWSRQTGLPQATVTGRELGVRELCLADLFISRQGVRLGALRTMQPFGPGYYATGSFLRDNRSFLFSAADSGASAFGADVYRYDARRRRTVRLTATPQVFDVQAQLAPNGELLVWSAGRPDTASTNAWRSELYIMRLQDSTVVQLTHFNEPGYDEFLRMPTDIGRPDWHPRGDTLAASYRYRRGIMGWQQRIFVLPLTTAAGEILPVLRRQRRPATRKSGIS